MSTSRTSGKQTTDSKASQQPNKPCSAAQLLPVSLLLHLMRFLDDFRSLARMQSVCRNLSALPSSQLDLCWHLRDWEAESATDDCILTNGESTPWKARYRQRARLEDNWLSGKGKLVRTISVSL